MKKNIIPTLAKTGLNIFLLGSVALLTSFSVHLLKATSDRTLEVVTNDIADIKEVA